MFSPSPEMWSQLLRIFRVLGHKYLQTTRCDGVLPYLVVHPAGWCSSAGHEHGSQASWIRVPALPLSSQATFSK